MSRDAPVKPGAVEARHVWKRYRSDMSRPLLRDRFAQIRRRSPRSWTWVLRDVELSVEPGESVALVGLNGSGKSTFLKILSGVTTQTAGRVVAGGRIGALIEVRAGIHPDLTGRENIFFSGTVLGLTRRDVAARFRDMVEFAEIGDAIDRPVRFYSSGMQMRLGFAVAAFLEPDVLLVDEALAVGDMGFQQRCLDRMRLVQEQGTTLLFVSHDLAAIEAMCRRSVWLDGGIVRAHGETRTVLQRYREGLEEKAATLGTLLDEPIKLCETRIEGDDRSGLSSGQPWRFSLELEAETTCRGLICVGVSQGPATPIFMVSHEAEIRKGRSVHRCTVDSLPLPAGRYYLWAGVFGADSRLMSWLPASAMDVAGEPPPLTPAGVLLLSPVMVGASWERQRRAAARAR